MKVSTNARTAMGTRSATVVSLSFVNVGEGGRCQRHCGRHPAAKGGLRLSPCRPPRCRCYQRNRRCCCRCCCRLFLKGFQSVLSQSQTSGTFTPQQIRVTHIDSRYSQIVGRLRVVQVIVRGGRRRSVAVCAGLWKLLGSPLSDMGTGGGGSSCVR